MVVFQVDENGRQSQPIVAGRSFVVEGTLTSDSKLRDRLMIKVVSKTKDGKIVVSQSGFAAVTQDKGGQQYFYSGTLQHIAKPGTYTVLATYLDQSNTEIDSLTISVEPAPKDSK